MNKKWFPPVATYRSALSLGLLERLNVFFSSRADAAHPGQKPYFTTPELVSELGTMLPKDRAKAIEYVSNIMNLLEAGGRVEKWPKMGRLNVWVRRGTKVQGIDYSPPFNTLRLLLGNSGSSLMQLSERARNDPLLARTRTRKSSSGKAYEENKRMRDTLAILEKKGLVRSGIERHGSYSHKLYFLTEKGRVLAVQSPKGVPCPELIRILS